MTVTTLRLKHYGGTIKEWPVVGFAKEPASLLIRIGFWEYNLLLTPNQLVRIEHGRRIKKTFPWSAENRQEAVDLYKILVDKTPKVW